MGLGDARAKTPSPHGEQAFFRVPAARGEEYAGPPLADANPVSREAAEWGER